MELLDGYLAVYGVLALTHLVIQTLCAHLEHRRQKREVREATRHWYAPPTTVVVPVYNEDPVTLRRCLQSLKDQAYDALEVILVDDGSPDQERLLPVYDEFAGGRFRILLLPDNRGKRHAQAVAFRLAKGEVIVTVDSDTILREPDAVGKLVEAFADESVGGATGNVAVDNRRDNLLTLLIGYRYWSAFNQERAAQSLFRVVMCCSGPFAAYRRSVVAAVLERYTSQRFRGKNCTFGDDRHLTNLVLEEGHDVVFRANAVADTAAPTSLRTFLRQQIRWNKSFFRELLWTLRFAHRRHPYLLADLACQVLLPLMLMAALGPLLYEAISEDHRRLGHYLLVMAGIGMLRAGYGMARTRDVAFFTFAIYAFIHVMLIKPTSLYALATLGRTHWGTRSAGGVDAALAEVSETPPPRRQPRPGLPAGSYSTDHRAVAAALVERRRDALLAARIVRAPWMQGEPPVVSIGHGVLAAGGRLAPAGS